MRMTSWTGWRSEREDFGNNSSRRRGKSRKRVCIFLGSTKPNFTIYLGVFGVPLELLAERDGVDSSLGVTKNPVRIPVFLDDIISAMRQMGRFSSFIQKARANHSGRRFGGGNLQEEWKHSKSKRDR